MKLTNSRVAVILVLFFVSSMAKAAGQANDLEGILLWQIGKADNDTREYLLGRGGYANFERDGFFVVGRSNPAKDWPYTHPGPTDSWAGGKRHAFTILFVIDRMVPSGNCRLMFDLVDTHSSNPPRLRIKVNNRSFDHKPPSGGSDASIFGDPKAGREHKFSVDFPAKELKPGVNEITITTVSGSWILYDWLGLEVPPFVELGQPRGALLRGVRLDPWLSRKNGLLCRRIWIDLTQIGKGAGVTLHVTGLRPIVPRLEPGNQTVELVLPPFQGNFPVTIELRSDGKTVGMQKVICKPAKEREPVDWVDPILGTSASRWMLYPGPSMPFSMVKLSPDNQRQQWKAGYEYLIENIAGFSHLHSWTMGGLLTMPTTGPLKVVPGTEGDPDKGYRSRFSHDKEVASPGYYAVTLDDYNIRAELTSTTRAGFQQYTFPKADTAHILFDLETPTEYGYTVLDAQIRKISGTEIEGYSKQRSGRYASWNEFTLHFVARLSKPFDSFGGWVGQKKYEDTNKISGKGDVGAFLRYSTSGGEIIKLKTGISLVSIEQARLNLETEMSKFGWDFEAVRNNARKTWNQLLSRIEIEGGTFEQKNKFYTNLYRSYCARTILSDVNGKYVDMYEKVRQLEDPDSPVYGCDAFWNTFWNLNQLWTLVTPDIANKWVKSLLEIYDRGGWLAKGPTGIEYSSIMVASHEIALIVSAYQKGIRNFDIDKAYRAMRHIQTEPGRPHKGGGHVGNRQLKSYKEYGYVPVENGPVSNTLEYAYDDWCVAQMAKALGKKEDYQYFTNRANNYRNVFDSSVGYMRRKHKDGTWVKGFSPYTSRGFVEGNSWQYTWFVPHDVKGLIDLIGKEEFNRRLEDGFVKSAKSNFNATHDRFADYPINHGNQPNMQAAYLFNFSGAPWLTQKWAREIMEHYYGTGAIDGYPGDEDQGQMGAWYVMSAMGLFEMDGGAATDPTYEIGSPIFDKVTIHLDDRYYKGGKFVIEAKNNSVENKYIQSATLDGKPLNKPWFYHRQLVDGGELVLQMGPEPNKSWGSAPEAAPPSMSR
ncbi:MAG: glycoside hydrolase family 92 protein [Phycisphaerae bacterium]|nr:glycoside hydrolase family 92 protein [Phycisphaerae bacterium]NIS50075.1 glycoside hydrolase family 92 protein [Phycisphaerae bacterium]NIU07730.1 glycoside hydrolase family 92 protein [Phycisphaerae bacterium]NIU55354.1 glycoside hydrolase family 92 protein [Phycisphaerae bacterium]NIW91821.1 glycoside hydrolase family 92 protein [Phycisphaerae bacterium]